VADFERLVRENQTLVYRIAFGLLRNRTDAEDVSQEVFLRAFRKQGRLQEVERFRDWVARITWRLALNHKRWFSRSLRRDTLWLESKPPEREDPESLRALRQEVDRLPEKLRQVVMLSAMEELETRDVARILEIPEGTVRSRLHQARKLLLKALYP
jgi:RNA polymerase sigma-70 factor (ECF subfamily)